jgi:F-type H+/Na+-transporting ATPase subunit beta
MNKGRVLQILGQVIYVKFETGQLPETYNAFRKRQDIDFRRAELALQRAINRLSVIGKQ